MPTLAWLGLGLMGNPMSKYLINNGYTVRGYDIDADACDRAAAKRQPGLLAFQSDVGVLHPDSATGPDKRPKTWASRRGKLEFVRLRHFSKLAEHVLVHQEDSSLRGARLGRPYSPFKLDDAVPAHSGTHILDGPTMHFGTGARLLMRRLPASQFQLARPREISEISGRFHCAGFAKPADCYQALAQRCEP
ncbi:hypothetical protein F6X40_39000 [Paraburkholderia sp. UCT31]|uniref:NAD(P)-binding domain-containing protein n=1 Tax=Paraburkholderia sp. UCT31 TaxID=2615209 RepID=UPI001654E339|nr:NAD(P)-binding domain-containing protein [Paraburkholderia sp. UCT31]MBC8742495.1 hypothetical protein [Paraburkholderia sp. UCT31]